LALPTDGLLEYLTVVPSEPLRLAFEGQVKALFAAMDLGHQQSRTLAALRDTLLPKLISGELCVKDAERFIGKEV
jgi:type I restriction enzyme, S subunit